jgi:hypothetical protein
MENTIKGLGTKVLAAEEIVAEAEAKAGWKDSETHLHPNLEALLASLNNDGKLSEVGEAAARRAMVARTADRLEGLKWLREYPEIAEERIIKPVILTGLPRSGTTYLQYLFDRDRRFRLIRTWESLTPSPPPGFDAASVALRKAAEAESRRQIRPEVKGFDALHLIDEGGSDECHAFLEQSYSAAGFHNLYDVPSYFNFLIDKLELSTAYRVHKRQLQLLQWKSPQPRWAVKYPNHVIAMDAIDSVYPEARFVMTHRDPVQLLASISKMTLALRSARYDPPIDPHRIGCQMRDFIRRHIDRIMAYNTSQQGERVVHVDYYGLVADPAKVMGDVHARLGIDSPEDVRKVIASWRRENPKNARGANDYALEQFGLNADEMAELFSDYARCFDIPSEREGLARIGALT